MALRLRSIAVNSVNLDAGIVEIVDPKQCNGESAQGQTPPRAAGAPTSGLTPIAGLILPSPLVSEVPILLQKSSSRGARSAVGIRP